MYIELHARSAFSFLEGASLPETLIATCANLNMPAMALLDRDGVYGSPRFYMAAKKAGLKAHIGAEVTTTGRGFTQVHPDHVTQKNPSVPLCLGGGLKLPLLVSSRCGYQNLCRLITKMKLRAAKGEGAVCEEELQEHAEGLICLTGDQAGPLASALKNGGIENARHCVARLSEIFGHDHVYVELQRHFQRPQEARNRAAIEIARSFSFLCLPPMECAMPPRASVRYAMFFPLSAIIAPWPRRGICWRRTPNVT